MSRLEDPFVEMDELTISNNVVFSQDRSIRALERLHCMAPSPRRGSPQASGSRCPSESSSRIRHLHGRPTILATSRVLRWAPSSGSPIPIRRVHRRQDPMSSDHMSTWVPKQPGQCHVRREKKGQCHVPAREESSFICFPLFVLLYFSIN
jgi:hypothetical protein